MSKKNIIKYTCVTLVVVFIGLGSLAIFNDKFGKGHYVNGKANEIPKHYTKNSENLSIDTKIKIDDKYRNGEVPKYKVKGSYQYNVNEAIKVFNEKYGITSKKENNKEYEAYTIKTRDGYTLIISNEGYLSYFNKDLENKYYNMPFTQTYNNFSDIDEEKQKRIDKVKDIYNLLYKNIKTTQFSVVKVDGDILNEMNDKIPSEDAKGNPIEKIDHTGDTVYLLGANQEVDNIPIEDGKYLEHAMFWINYMGNFNIYAEMDNNNIINLSVSRLMNLEKSGKEKLKDFDEIYKVVENKFSDLLDAPKFTVTSCTFIERIIQNKEDYEAVPCWKFICKSENGEVPVLINAVTGEEMPILGSKVFN